MYSLAGYGMYDVSHSSSMLTVNPISDSKWADRCYMNTCLIPNVG